MSHIVRSRTRFLFAKLFTLMGKPMIPHLLRCQGFGVDYYSLTLSALNLEHPQLLQRWGKLILELSMRSRVNV